MARLVASAILVAAVAVAGMTGAFAQSGGGANPNSGTGIGKLQPPPPPPPPPVRKSGSGIGKLQSPMLGSSGATDQSGTGIGKLQPLQSAGPGFAHGTVAWVGHANRRFGLRHHRTRIVFHVTRGTVFRLGHHRTSFRALHSGQRVEVVSHWRHHRRMADRVTISRR